uniref:tRNA-uridine aminocarboxypropyltransferase n=1 Tax=Alexandrium catenella TaxID=2925 RepID=A0A7S1WVN9_ALECA
MEFRADPGHRCADCWLLTTHCCCRDVAAVRLRQHVVVLMHHAELNKRRGSNTAKLLLRFGAQLLVWGLAEHDHQLRKLLSHSNALILFPAPGARRAADLAEAARAGAPAPDCIVVLDGGWKETRKMNQSLEPHVQRCCVSTATRGEYGSTRKYRNGERERVQTAGAFIALLRELGEDEGRVEQLASGLASFMGSFERQLHWSGVPEADLRTRVPQGSPAAQGAA